MKLSEKTLKILAFLGVLIGAILEFNDQHDNGEPDKLSGEPEKKTGEL